MKTLIKRLLLPFNLVLPAKVNGQRFKVPVLRGIGASNLNITEPWMTDALRRLLALAPGTAFLDVGVNLGQTLLKLKSLNHDIAYYGFEPNPFCVHYVNELIRLNHLKNSEVIPIGLAHASGLIELIADSEADTAASIISDLRPGKSLVRRQHIPVFPLDDIAASLVSSPFRVLKIDVEGAELEVLSGIKQILTVRRPWVTCEVLHAHSAAQLPMLRERNGKLMKLLKDSRYASFRILKDTAQTRVIGLEPVDEFSESVWNPQTSPALCDYLFAPEEAVPETVKAFS